jgi:thiol peroxidase
MKARGFVAHATWLVAVVALGSCNRSERGAVGEPDVVAFLQAAPADQRDRIIERVAPPTAGAEPAGQPAERTGVVARGDRPLTLVGDTPAVGDPAPDFELTGKELASISLSDYSGKVLLLSVVPSIDTRVCEMQTHRIAEEEPKVPDGVAVLTVSRDLPFAQSRFIEEVQIPSTLASDYKTGAFGRDWGLVVKETGLLARSLWVIDAGGVIVYRELVADQGSEPDYEPALTAMREAATP